MTEKPALGSTEKRVFQLFAFLSVLGMVVAAWSATTWSDVERARNLIVVAPDGTQIHAVDGPQLIDQTQGVHTWTVLPGPLTLEVSFVGHEPQRTTVVVPKGLGGLMLAIEPDDDGALELAYF